ncbi:MAG: hypothetical protein HYS27_00485 [Deltaproteobacteria bacterium]|nr:hypothetical protein [Deltaproteobacteria bacterium]
MSAFDELYAIAAEAKRREGGGHRRDGWQGSIGALEMFDLRRISDALEAARQSEGQPLPEHYALPDYPGQAASLAIDGKTVGSHGLTLVDGDTCYQATAGVDGVTPALQVRPRRWLRPIGDEREAWTQFGDVQRTGAKALDRALVIRATSRRAAAVFLTPALIEQLVRLGSQVRSVTVRPEAGRTFVEVLVEVRDAARAEPGIALARAAYFAMQTLVATPGGFAEASEAAALELDDVLALVERVKETVAFLAGHVARVGDGVEARLELDEPAGLHAVLRVEPAAARELRATFRGDLPLPHITRATRLEPEVGFLKRAQGLVDPKVGDAALDRAFLIEGDVALARVALADPMAALRLAGRGGSLAIDAAGLSARVPRLALDDDALLEVVVALVASWREAALVAAGFAASSRQA